MAIWLPDAPILGRAASGAPARGDGVRRLRAGALPPLQSASKKFFRKALDSWLQCLVLRGPTLTKENVNDGEQSVRQSATSSRSRADGPPRPRGADRRRLGFRRLHRGRDAGDPRQRRRGTRSARGSVPEGARRRGTEGPARVPDRRLRLRHAAARAPLSTGELRWNARTK